MAKGRSIKNKVGLSLSMSLLLGLTQAHAQTPADQLVVTVDHKGMPRCLSTQSHPDQGVLFIWDKSDGFSRPVQAISLAQAASQWGLNIDTSDGNAITCDDWKDLLDGRDPKNDAKAGLTSVIGPRDPKDPQHTMLPMNDAPASVLGYTLEPRVQTALAQVSMGGEVYHPEATADQYLQAHPITEFNVDLDKTLTNNFGNGFAGAIYKAWVESEPKNSKFRTDTLQTLQGLETGAVKLSDISNRLKKYTLVLGPGFMLPKTQGILKTTIADITAIGIDLQVMDIERMAPIATNIPLIQKQMQALLDQNKHLIIVGMSKGMPEILTAAMRMIQQNPKLAVDDGVHGSIDAALSLSGIYDGVFFVEWAEQLPQSLFVNGKLQTFLYPAAKGMGITPQELTLNGLYSMDGKTVRAYTQENLAHLPPGFPLVSVIGVIPGDGTAVDGGIRTLQNMFVKQYIQGAGATDGYEQYPGTSIPRAGRSASVRELVFDSSHMVLDGSFEGRDLQVQANASNVIAAVLQNLLQMLPSNN